MRAPLLFNCFVNSHIILSWRQAALQTPNWQQLIFLAKWQQASRFITIGLDVNTFLLQETVNRQ